MHKTRHGCRTKSDATQKAKREKSPHKQYIKKHEVHLAKVRPVSVPYESPLRLCVLFGASCLLHDHLPFYLFLNTLSRAVRSYGRGRPPARWAIVLKGGRDGWALASWVSNREGARGRDGQQQNLCTEALFLGHWRYGRRGRERELAVALQKDKGAPLCLDPRQRIEC